MSNHKSNAPTVADHVGRQISRYGLTTAPIVARTLCDGDRRLAERTLHVLRERRRVVAHTAGRLTYYTRGDRPLSPQALDKRLSILWYCGMTPPPKQLLALGRLRKLELPPLPCYMSKQGVVTWIRVHPRNMAAEGRTLQDALIRLQEPVRRPEFKRLAYFAKEGRFAIDYLMRSQREAAEFDLWLHRRPLFTPLRDPPVHIPVNVVVMSPATRSP